MATNDVSMADAPANRPDRRVNGSPPPAQSKRDKRRQMLVDKLATLNEKFSKDRDQAYREQLTRIQIDTSLVMSFDPYVDRPLDKFEEEYAKLQQVGGGDGPAKSLLEKAGPKFAKWMEKVQDLIEQRDYALTKFKFDYEKKTSEYLNTHAFKTETANREFKALSQTLRDRLINSIMAKKFRLNKEKEALEIADSNALLLHPNQYSITNPSSPGGTHGKRATRLRREMEEMAMEGKKRKRGYNDDDGSPVPQRRHLDTSNSTPMWQTDRLINRKATGPIYSIDKLFTDKELAMYYNAAALAARKYLLTHKPKLDENGHPIHEPGTEGADGDKDDDGDSMPSAPMMERNVSHATRSNRGNPNFTDDKLMGIEMLANFDFPGNFERMLAADPKLPPTFPSTYVKGYSKMEYNIPSSLSTEDANQDLMVINALKQYDAQFGVGASFDMPNGSGSRKLLEAASISARDHRYVAYLQGERPSENQVRRQLGLPVLSDVVEPIESNVRASTPKVGPIGGSTPGPSPAKGGVPMSRQSSANGVPMSRSSSRKGGRGGRGG